MHRLSCPTSPRIGSELGYGLLMKDPSQTPPTFIGASRTTKTTRVDNAHRTVAVTSVTHIAQLPLLGAGAHVPLVRASRPQSCRVNPV